MTNISTPRLVRVSQVALAVLLLIKAYITLTMPPIGDEAYYWMWGQKLAWSYFDHPPLHAWLLRLMGVIFGWNLFSLRVLTWLTLGGTLLLFRWWAKRLAPENPAGWFWPAAAIYVAMPMIFTMTSIVFNDHLLIFLSLAAITAFLVFVEKWESDRTGFRWLYAAATLLGLAVLTKYNGVFVAVGFALFLAIRKPTRALFLSPHTYLAGLLSVALQAPVIWWNVTEGLASYKFHLSERWGSGPLTFNVSTLADYLGLTLIYTSPFLIPAIWGIFRRSFGTPFADRARLLAILIFTLSSLMMLALSLFVRVAPYWNIVAVVPMMPLLFGYIRRRWVIYVHFFWGFVLAVLMAINNTMLPITTLLTHRFDWTTSSAFGWPVLAEHVTQLRKLHPVSFIAASRYTTAAQLGYALQDPEVVGLANRHDQYDYWFDPQAHEGESALVVSDPQLGLKYFTAHFDKLTKLETVPYVRFGSTLYKPSIYLAEGFHALAVQKKPSSAAPAKSK